MFCRFTCVGAAEREGEFGKLRKSSCRRHSSFIKKVKSVCFSIIHPSHRLGILNSYHRDGNKKAARHLSCYRYLVASGIPVVSRESLCVVRKKRSVLSAHLTKEFRHNFDTGLCGANQENNSYIFTAEGTGEWTEYRPGTPGRPKAILLPEVFHKTRNVRSKAQLPRSAFLRLDKKNTL